MTTKVKVFFTRSTQAGQNAGDSAMLEPVDAGKVVKSGDAVYADKPAPKAKAKPKSK
jgi:hypothetical protein